MRKKKKIINEYNVEKFDDLSDPIKKFIKKIVDKWRNNPYGINNVVDSLYGMEFTFGEKGISLVMPIHSTPPVLHQKWKSTKHYFLVDYEEIDKI